MIAIRTKEEIANIRHACQIAAKILRQLGEYLHPGISTAEVDRKAAELLQGYGTESAFKGYGGFPANICTSINEEVVHGIPGKRILEDGDIIGLDVGTKINGYFGDVACTIGVGEISQQAEKLLRVTEESLYKGIALALPGNHLFDISNAIQKYAESFNFAVVRKFVGHGIGSKLHEEPEIPNFGKAGIGPILKAGMVLAIEPMVNEGTFDIEILPDQWTAVTKDRRLSAHFEHTICITEQGPLILTTWE
ncbi:MAG: type I methionyl aminopeptidase [Candidatus Omnitrophota bacterium]